MALRTITGQLASWGSIEENQNGARHYTYLRFNAESGSDGYCEGVMTLPVLDSLLRNRETQTFFFAEVRFPRYVTSRLSGRGNVFAMSIHLAKSRKAR